MKKIILVALFAAAALTACKESEKENMSDLSDDVMDTVENSTENMKDKVDEGIKKTAAFTEEQSTQMANDFESNVQVKDGKITSIKGYDGYSNLQSSFVAFQNADAVTMKEKGISLRESYNAFVNSMPAYLRTKRVNREVTKVGNEIKEYEEEMVDKNASEKRNRRNMNNIQDAFDDLEKQMVKAREKFIDNKEDAMEEYMEEINSNSNQTTTERYLDATEEYNEEMKDK